MPFTPDFRSPAWLEGSVRYARDYSPRLDLAKELHAAGPEAIKDAMSTIFALLSNRALREVADGSSRWMKDLALCEEEAAQTGEELCDSLKSMKVACQVLCDLSEQARCVRGSRRQ